MPSWVALLCLGLASVQATVIGDSNSNDDNNSSFPYPSEDGFYDAPSDLGSQDPGHVIRSRTFVSRYGGDFSENYQYFYRTNDHTDTAIGTGGTVFVPQQPSQPPKIFVYSIPEDSDNINCAPSYVWVNGTPTRDTASNELFMNWGVAKGYYVVTVDQEGPDGSWLVGKTEGQAVLDGVRAAISLLDLPAADTTVAMYGYSGGAFTTVWATTLAASYAPELNIVGAAHGGTPVDLTQTLDDVNGTAESQLAIAGVVGLANGYPDVEDVLPDIVTPLGRNVTDTLRYLCTDANNYTILTSGSVNPLFTTNPLDVPEIMSAVVEQSLLPNVSTVPVPVPRFPRFIFNGKSDTIVPYDAVTQYVNDQCSRGADIRFVGFDLLDHLPAAVAGEVATLEFLESALEGAVVPVPCGSPVVTPYLGDVAADLYLGVQLAPIAARTILTG